ncbi:MAG: CDP-alcohol phosphatidyltransferase family protein [Calditrichaceae bacterium]|nr:CDP-alcohol phosphatidyltransferase family protein [Calditrichaceae bacterium]MBN2709496.1 CDP-alcohol phosphatidyltransferase family protein [Calditrichaceae bacterium]RQV95956.1 MAG: CDP-alcohol phosphatidyltransferase family protein [Calditrichota bacterium]
MNKTGKKNQGSVSLLPAWLQGGFVSLLNPFIKLFIRMKINPNTFTVWGLLFNIAATVLIILHKSYINWAGAMILIGGICDILDGKVARSAGRETKFGALFDSSVDRYSEVIMFFGIGLFYVRDSNYLLSVIAFIALGGSTMVSYVRARAESLGFKAKVGLMQRPERIVFIGSGALFYFPIFDITIFHVENFPVTLLEIAIWSIAVLANFTALQRLIYAYKQDNSKSKE